MMDESNQSAASLNEDAVASGPSIPVPRSSGGPVQAPPKYKMTISRLTIDKLGIKLYDRVTAVLAELIANSYDADANVVKIALPFACFLDQPQEEEWAITIED